MVLGSNPNGTTIFMPRKTKKLKAGYDIILNVPIEVLEAEQKRLSDQADHLIDQLIDLGLVDKEWPKAPTTKKKP